MCCKYYQPPPPMIIVSPQVVALIGFFVLLALISPILALGVGAALIVLASLGALVANYCRDSGGFGVFYTLLTIAGMGGWAYYGIIYCGPGG